MNKQNFEVGKTYKIIKKDWESPDGELIKGKELTVEVLAPATKDNSEATVVCGDYVENETLCDKEVEHLKKFLRVKNVDTNVTHFLHPDTIDTYEEVGSLNDHKVLSEAMRKILEDLDNMNPETLREKFDKSKGGVVGYAVRHGYGEGDK